MSYSSGRSHQKPVCWKSDACRCSSSRLFLRWRRIVNVVLVVAAPPEAGLVATEWRAVEPLVHAPEAVDPPPVCRVSVVDDTALEHERAHAGPFSPVRREVRSHARCRLAEHGPLLGGPKVH